jgi:hypothetical protein
MLLPSKAFKNISQMLLCFAAKNNGEIDFSAIG